jgi:flagella basal body P-ring formation protein FlgA
LKKSILFLAVVILLIITFNAAAFQIKISPEVEVESPQITLAEISEIKAPELSRTELEELRSLSFKASPNPGYSKRLSQVLVNLTIQNLGYKKEEFQLQMPKTVIVNRKSNLIKEAEIYALAAEYLKKNLDFKSDNLIIESRTSLNEIEIPAGDYTLKIVENQNLSLPNTSLKLEVWQNEERLRSFFYPVEIKLVLKVLTAEKDLKSNTNVRKSDFKLKEESISGDPEQIVKNFSEIDLNNVELSRSLKKGELLKFSYLKIPYAVKWGQKLNLRLNRNNIRISTFVEAKERGKIGEIITVENLNSGYQFQVEVISPTEVKMISD